LRKNWDWLVSQISDRVNISASSLLLAGFAALSLSATVWLLWPLQASNEWTAFFVPTASPTATRVVVHRKPTPTAFVPTVTPLPVIHVVQEDEVLGLIAEAYGTTVEALLEANELEDGDLISIGQELVIVDAEGTPMVIEVVVPSPTVTPTPAFAYQAPLLLGPDEGIVFHGQDAAISLRWAAVAMLNHNEWYQVRVWSQGEEHAYRAWTKASSWLLPPSVYAGADGNRLSWNVSIVRRHEGQTIPLSPPSRTRQFDWQ
jgi:LysM repeat protein